MDIFLLLLCPFPAYMYLVCENNSHGKVLAVNSNQDIEWYVIQFLS